jgi:glycosyltransferase involved in cell wall biosynthesis
VAGSHLDPWDARILPRLESLGVSPTVLGPMAGDGGIPTTRVESVRDINPWRRIPLMEHIGYKIHGFAWDHGLGRMITPFGLDDAVVGFSRIARDFDILQVFETYRASAYQACKIHPAVVVKVTENIPFNPPMWPYRSFRRFVRLHARRFVCVSQSARAALLQEGFDQDRIRIIPEPVDTEMFHPESSAPPTERPFTVGYAAQMDVAHGLPDLLQAFASLSQSVDARLRIVGGGRLDSVLSESLRELHIEDRVDYLGKVGYEEMPAFLHGVDVLCVPCREIPGWKPQFGMVNIEAMACGIPIVATRAGATPEIVPPGLEGFLASPGDDGAIAEALAILAPDRALRERLGREARDWVVQRYDAARVAAQWGSLFSEVASETGRR